MLFRRIADPKLAQYAYLVGCSQSGEALLVDPQRDIDRYRGAAAEEGLEIVAVTETHIHADFLSGAREYAEQFGTTVYLSDEGDEDWKYEWARRASDRPKGQGGYDVRWLEDGDTFTVGTIQFSVLHVPGHTPEHLSFVVSDNGGRIGDARGVLTGDFVFVGDLGRPDLLESAAQIEGTMEGSARRLHESVQRFLELPDHLQVWPGHGAGSACGKALGAVPQSTVGYEKRFNPMIDAARNHVDSFVETIVDGQPEPQMYFSRMKRDNKEGPPLLGALPTPDKLTVEDLERAAENPEMLVIDTRLDRSAFMANHIPGALYAPMNRSFNTVVGSLVEDETASLVVIVDEEDVEEAVRDLVRIGYDDICGFAEVETLQRYFREGGDTETIDEITFEDLRGERASNSAVVLDVRYRSEYEDGHVDGALNASYTRLPEYEADLPMDETLLVHCGTGARAAAASAFLARTGRKVKYVNDNFQAYVGG